MLGICSHCQKQLIFVNVEPVDGHLGDTTLRSIAFQCPYCRAVLGVTADPLAIKTDTVNEVLQRLRKG